MITKLISLCLISCVFGLPITEKSPLEGDLFEGDIAGVNENTLKGLAQQDNGGNKKWPNGVVPYVIQTQDYTQTQLDNIDAAMRHIEDVTRVNGKNCITFVPRSTESTYISISSQTGCWSYVGKNTFAGAQQVSLQAPGCVGSKGIPAHEFTHALGFWHEQSRPDRDNYVVIYWENIQAGQSSNFDKYTKSIDTLGFPYDYNSIMHYHPTSFSVNGQPTILPLLSGVSIGNKQELSTIDIGEIRKYYGC